MLRIFWDDGSFFPVIPESLCHCRAISGIQKYILWIPDKCFAFSGMTRERENPVFRPRLVREDGSLLIYSFQNLWCININPFSLIMFAGHLSFGNDGIRSEE